MLVIPTQPVPSQTLGVQLNGQDCAINVYQKGQLDYLGLYVDLYVNNALVIGGVFSLIGVKIVRAAYLGFSGDLVFYDTQTPMSVSPYYTGLGGRYFLAYLDATEANDP